MTLKIIINIHFVFVKHKRLSYKILIVYCSMGSCSTGTGGGSNELHLGSDSNTSGDEDEQEDAVNDKPAF